MRADPEKFPSRKHTSSAELICRSMADRRNRQGAFELRYSRESKRMFDATDLYQITYRSLRRNFSSILYFIHTCTTLPRVTSRDRWTNSTHAFARPLVFPYRDIVGAANGRSGVNFTADAYVFAYANTSVYYSVRAALCLSLNMNPTRCPA